MTAPKLDQRREEILAIAQELFAAWPLFDPARYRIDVGRIRGSDSFYVAMSERLDPHNFRTTRIDFNIVGDVCYLLTIRLRKEHCGRGYGDALYKLAIELGRRCGCGVVNQVPSGQARTGERRDDYLARRGWQHYEFGFEMYYELRPGAAELYARAEKARLEQTYSRLEEESSLFKPPVTT